MANDKKRKRKSKRKRKKEREKEEKAKKVIAKIEVIEQRGNNKELSELENALKKQNEMMKKMGLPVSFESTKGKEVPEANASAVRLRSKRRYRQYMNNKGGFNRNLAPSF
ncbi:hypothetical protein MHBO_000002 [Bonamia ostreae]|uniref:U4/U6.U5 small nuclear ribonucleoprotein 27kDa protein domain-containing protein n=1 Tax=Bonamia ostreae TaxID=126728 RepID=A0ABV2AF16_9EUKA